MTFRHIVRMKSISFLISLMLFVLTTGCASSPAKRAAALANRDAAAQGLPFRWEAKAYHGGNILVRTMVDLHSGPTRANAVLKADILALLQKAEASLGRPALEVEEVRLLPDGREVWVLQLPTPGERIGYIISLRPVPTGGTDILLNGPHPFTKTPDRF
ncbi:MAG: hypothetical protein K9M98_12125 [Cephaloticoccus sp.]|nr:hypothetical protein [Cephaloticoccus sp.]